MSQIPTKTSPGVFLNFLQSCRWCLGDQPGVLLLLPFGQGLQYKIIIHIHIYISSPFLLLKLQSVTLNALAATSVSTQLSAALAAGAGAEIAGGEDLV